MKTRVISGIALLIMLVATLGFGGYVTAGVLLFVSLVAYHELAGAFSFSLKEKQAGKLEIAGLIAIVIHYLCLVVSGGEMRYFVLLTMLLFVADAGFIVFNFPEIHSSKLLAAIFSYVYAPMMLSFIYLLRIRPDGIYWACLPFIAWVCDTCAYFAGSTLGKHKLCPKLSPKKTVEGAIGGVVGSVVVGIIFGFVFGKYATSGIDMTKSILYFAVITAVAGAVSMIGDLIASAIKRDHDFKDYGKLIPGHGGIMDRFDSVIFITPVIYFMVTFFFN